MTENKFDAFHAFEHYKQLSDEDRAKVRALHKALRARASSREGNLAWGFVRGFPYRRIERSTRTQVQPDGTVVSHNPPPLLYVAQFLAQHIPGLEDWFENKYRLKPTCPLVIWAANLEGAIPAPPSRPKRPYAHPEVA